MKGTQSCINKVIKAIKVVQHFGDGTSKPKGEKKGDDFFDHDYSPRASAEAGSSKHGSWAAKCIKAGGKGKAGADRLLKAAKGRTLSQVLTQTSKRIEPPSYAHALAHSHQAVPPSKAVDRGKTQPSSKCGNSDPPVQIVMWIGDQHIDIGQVLLTDILGSSSLCRPEHNATRTVSVIVNTCFQEMAKRSDSSSGLLGLNSYLKTQTGKRNAPNPDLFNWCTLPGIIFSCDLAPCIEFFIIYPTCSSECFVVRALVTLYRIIRLPHVLQMRWNP